MKLPLKIRPRRSWRFPPNWYLLCASSSPVTAAKESPCNRSTHPPTSTARLQAWTSRSHGNREFQLARSCSTISPLKDIYLRIPGRGRHLLSTLPVFAVGDQIRVVGKKAEQTNCLKGPAIRVETVDKVKISQTKPEGSQAEPKVKIVTKDATGSVAATAMESGEVRRLRMRGTLNDEVKVKKCQGFRNLRGELWALTGDLKTFKSGDKVHLEGVQDPSKECGAPTLKVTSIEAFKE
jgi:hypothetical protein